MSVSGDNNNNNSSSSSSTKPVLLPKEGQRNILITSALPYVNNVPHLGNIVGSVLSADVFSRYCKLRGLNAVYICGTDEYGTATETKALMEKVTPKEICDKYNKIHAEIYEWFDIGFDKFGRTSTAEQTAVAQDIFLKLHKNGFLLEDTVSQLFCEKCQKFLADRFVEGICPLCGFNDARGDQCDGCGKLLNAVELVNPRCKVDGTQPVVKNTEHMFLDLPKLVERLEKWVDESAVKGEWAPHAIQTTKSWIKEGLKPRCITRDLKWGTPVPLAKFADKVFYVWFDAPIGYISITATYTDQWERWWKNPSQVELYQFMGKDNIPFHTVIFPASLIGTEDKYTLLHHVSTTEYLNYEGGKFSKSRNLGVFGNHAKETGIPCEVWRYYLLVNRPENSDSSFSWDDFLEKNNNELLANLGNLVNRALAFVKSTFGGVIPAVGTPFTAEDQQFLDALNKEWKEYLAALDKVHIKDGLKVAMGIGKLANKYMQDNKPWDLAKNDLPRCQTVIHVVVNAIKGLAALLEPYMPALTRKIYKQLNWQHHAIADSFTLEVPAGHVIGTPEAIFRRIEKADIEKWKKQYGGDADNNNNNKKSEDAFPLDLRGAQVVSVADHPSDPSLYVVQIDLGTEQRQVVARLKDIYDRNVLQGRNVLVLCNLPPAEIKGVKSEAMILVAESKKKDKTTLTSLLETEDKPTAAWPGTRVVPDGVVQEIRVHITLKEFQKLDLKIGKDGKAVFKQKFPLKTQTQQPLQITAQGAEPAAKIK